MRHVASPQTAVSSIEAYGLEQQLQMAECRYARARQGIAEMERLLD